MDPINLYDGKEYFEFETEDTYARPINEPIGWNEMASIIERSKYHGFNSEYISGEKEFIFPLGTPENELPGGGDFLMSLYNTTGYETVVYFVFGIYIDGLKEEQFRGKINLYDYDRDAMDDRGVKVTIEVVYFEAKIRTRIDTPIAINALEDLDFGTVDPADLIDEKIIRLHSKQIIKESEAEMKTPFKGVLLDDAGIVELSYQKWIQPSGENLIKSELPEVSEMPFGVGITDPQASSLFQFLAKEDGRFDLNFNGSATFSGGSSSAATGIPGDRLVTYVVEMLVYRNGTLINQLTGTTATRDEGNFVNSIDFIFNDNFSAFVLKDDEIYWHVRIDHQTTDSGGAVNPASLGIGMIGSKLGFTSNFKATQWTERRATTAHCYNWFDALTYCVRATTGKSNRVKSKFFGPGGQGYKYIIANGYQLRNFNVAVKPLTVTIQDILDTMNAFFCIGVGYQTIAGDDYMIVEPVENFYRRNGNPVYKFGNVQEYFENYSKDVIYNQFTIGYKKYPDKETLTLDEFNTEQSWLLPLKSYKGGLDALSPFIGSGYSIEIQRREQYSENPTESKTDDDEIFIVAYTEDMVYPQSINYLTFLGTDKFGFNVELGMEPGDQFIMTGTLNGGITYTVMGREVGGEIYIVSPTPFPVSGTVSQIDITHTSGTIFAERNQNFQVTAGVYSPGTSYNLRQTPKHMGYCWAPFLNICMFYNDTADKIKVTFSKNNNALRSQFIPGDTAKLNVDNQVITEGADITLSDFYNKQAIYQPRQAKYKAVMTYRDVNLIKKAMRSELPDISFGVPDPRNLTFVTYIDDQGKHWAAFIMKIEYNHANRFANIEVRKIEEL